MIKLLKTPTLTKEIATYYQAVSVNKIEQEIVDSLTEVAKKMARQIMEKYDLETVFEQQDENGGKIIVIMNKKI
jgi:hypothetical protein